MNHSYTWRHAWGWIGWYLRRGRVIAGLRQAWLALVLGYDGEACQFCGRSYILWSSPDDLWLRVMGSPAGLACPVCFDRLATRAGVPLRWIPQAADLDPRAEYIALLEKSGVVTRPEARRLLGLPEVAP